MGLSKSTVRNESMRDQQFVVYFTATILVLALLIYRAYLRQPPSRAATDRVLRYVESAMRNQQFVEVIQYRCAAASDDWTTFSRRVGLALHRERGEAIPDARTPFYRSDDSLDLMRVGSMRGGWVDRHPATGRPTLALAHYPFGFLGHAAAVHELFHLVRDQLFITTFAYYADLSEPGKTAIGIYEEVLVWWKTWFVAPAGTAVIVFVHGLAIVTACLALAGFVRAVLSA